MKKLLKKIFCNRKVLAVLSAIWVLITMPYYITVSIISGIAFVYGVLHDFFATLLGRRDRAHVGDFMYGVSESLDAAWDACDEELKKECY